MHITIGKSTSIKIYSNNTKTTVTLTTEFQLPEGATFDPKTGIFTWNPSDYVNQPLNIT